jgi:hypothetical protein
MGQEERPGKFQFTRIWDKKSLPWPQRVGEAFTGLFFLGFSALFLHTVISDAIAKKRPMFFPMPFLLVISPFVYTGVRNVWHAWRVKSPYEKARESNAQLSRRRQLKLK